jgi:hypothetical protein
MNTRHLWGLVLILLLLYAGPLLAQELTTDIYPSEDELAEALERGDIDSAQYYLLWQLRLFGLDSSNVFLEDIIPNLSHFLPLPAELTNTMEHSQREPFIRERPHPRDSYGSVRQQWYRPLEQDKPWAYNTDLRLQPSRTIRSDLSLRRSRSGTERFVRRSFTWTPDNSPLRRLTLGNFTTRFAMGSIIGHPGKLLTSPKRLSGQSLLFPDYAGYNGLLSEWRLRQWQAQTVTALSRDEHFELLTAAALIERNYRRSRLGIISGFNRLRNRHDRAASADLNLGLTGHTRYSSGYVSSEISYQLGDRPSWRAALLEGRHRFRHAQLSYAVWAYGNNWHDLTAGSKSAILRLPDTVSNVAFAYSSRRIGQNGGLLRTIVKLSPQLDLTNNLVAGYHTDGSHRFQWLAALDWQTGSPLAWRFDLLLDNRQLVTSTAPDRNDLRIRLQSRFTSANWLLRTYIACQTREDRPDFASLLIDSRLTSPRLGRIDLWANLARWNLKQRTLDYYYMYLQFTQQYLNSLEIALKLAHRYAREYSQQHQTSVSITTTVTL